MVDARGRKVGYTVCDRNGFGGFVNPHKIVAGEIFHYYSPSRFEAYRGVTAFHTVLNDFRDLKETHDAEKVAAKLASFQTILERNAAGAAKARKRSRTVQKTTPRTRRSWKKFLPV